MTPASALESCETALRQLLVHVFAEKHGAEWFGAVFTPEQIAQFEERRDEEQKKRLRHGVATMSNALIDYTQFFHLLALAEKNWELVTPALGKKADTMALLRRIDGLRNTVAHNRPLLPFEEDLVAGIAGEIRNTVTKYMSEQDENGNYYARIEEVSDSFGNQIDAVQTMHSQTSLAETGLTLNIGDIVTFRCRASDPHDRPLTWTIQTWPGHNEPFALVSGEEVELQWKVTEAHVSTSTAVWIRLFSDGPYHRWSTGNDGWAVFNYRVNPPAIGAAT